MTATDTAVTESTVSAEDACTQALELTLKMAVHRHQAGDVSGASQLYRVILDVVPEQPQANHNLGLLLLQIGHPAAGLPHLEAALAAKPESERYWLSYIDALAQAGQKELAQTRLAFAREHGLAGDEADTLQARLDPAALTASNGQIASSAVNVGRP